MPSPAIVILAIALCMSGGFQQGYIAAVLNQPYVFMERFINETIQERIGDYPSPSALNVAWSSLNCVYSVSFIVGQFMATWCVHKFGRKGTALLTCIFYIPGVLLSTFSELARSFELLFIGRIVWCLANGVNSVVGTVWVIECAPPRIRGAMSSIQEFFMALGALYAQSTGLPLASPTLWPFCFLPIVPFIVLSIVLFCLVPESYVTIMEKHESMDKARKSLAKYYGVAPDHPSVEAELSAEKEIEDRREEKREDDSHQKSGISWIFNPFSDCDDKLKVIRHAAWLGMLVKIAYVFTGARTLRGYSTFVLHELSYFTIKGAGMGSLAISLIRLPVTIFPVFFVDRFGRRPLMLVSMVVTVVCLGAMMGGIIVGGMAQYLVLSAFTMLVLINSAGLGSISRFYAAEVVPRSMMLEAISVLSGLETLIRIFVDFSFYPVAKAIGVYSTLMLLVPCAISLVLMWAMCPETSGRCVYEVLNEIAARKKMKVQFTKN